MNYLKIEEGAIWKPNENANSLSLHRTILPISVIWIKPIGFYLLYSKGSPANDMNDEAVHSYQKPSLPGQCLYQLQQCMYVALEMLDNYYIRRAAINFKRTNS